MSHTTRQTTTGCRKGSARERGAAPLPIPRAPARAALGLGCSLPFTGVDLWTAYEISWLDQRGKPMVAIGHFRVPAESPYIAESKSVKFYLNSLNQMRFPSAARVEQAISEDLSRACGSPVAVKLVAPTEERKLVELPGESIDELDVDVAHYFPRPELLQAGGEIVEETLVSNLFKSNCPMTGQPDWASVSIGYRGPRIDRSSLLCYLVSFRQHGSFHEHCVEQIFVEIGQRCAPERLTVYARFTRRGGIDINPFRSNWEAPPIDNVRGARQ
jgi:7-cyano-7-deazaguanine reductase